MLDTARKIAAASILALGLVAVGCGEEASVALEYPSDLGQMVIPANNPQTDAKVTLGRQLFFDARLSVDGTRSCYSCHMNEHGNGGGEPTAIGALGRALTRHSPVIWNVGYMKRWYWDGRAGSLEEQAMAAWRGGNMGVGQDGLEAKAREVGAVAEYAAQFDLVFPNEDATPETIVQAIAAYERTLVCSDTRYDRFARGEEDALSGQEREGLELFMGRAACAACHTPPLFSNQSVTEDGTYYNVGIGIEGKPEAEVDTGRMRVTEQDSDWAAFKTPSLRNVSRSAPYFHDGSVGDLEAAVRFMAGGGYPNRNLSPLLQDRGLSDDDVAAIVAFLGSLECGVLDQAKLP
jgi:cytochrome c peroxidase